MLHGLGRQVRIAKQIIIVIIVIIVAIVNGALLQDSCGILATACRTLTELDTNTPTTPWFERNMVSPRPAKMSWQESLLRTVQRLWALSKWLETTRQISKICQYQPPTSTGF